MRKRSGVNPPLTSRPPVVPSVSNATTPSSVLTKLDTIVGRSGRSAIVRSAPYRRASAGGRAPPRARRAGAVRSDSQSGSIRQASAGASGAERRGRHRRPPDPAHVDELAAEVRLLDVRAAVGARPGHRIVLADAAHLRAQVVGLEVDGDAVGLEHRHQPVGDLVGHPLLHAEPPRRDPDQPGQLADPDDLLVGDVPDVRPPEERQDVVLAQGEERDRPLDDLRQLAVGAAVALGREGGQQLRVAVVAVGRVEQRPDEPARGLGRARASSGPSRTR